MNPQNAEPLEPVEVNVSTLQDKTLTLKRNSLITLSNTSESDCLIIFPLSSTTKIVATKGEEAKEDVIKGSKGVLLVTDTGTYLPLPDEDGKVQFKGSDLGADGSTNYKIVKLSSSTSPVAIGPGIEDYCVYKSSDMEKYEIIRRVDLSAFTDEQKKNLIVGSNFTGKTGVYIYCSTDCGVINESSWKTRGTSSLREMNYSNKDHLYIYASVRISGQKGYSLSDYYENIEEAGRVKFATDIYSPVDLPFDTETSNVNDCYRINTKDDGKTYRLVAKNYSFNDFWNLCANAIVRLSSNGKTYQDFFPYAYDDNTHTGYISLGKLKEKFFILQNGIPTNNTTLTLEEAPQSFDINDYTITKEQATDLSKVYPLEPHSLFYRKLSGFSTNGTNIGYEIYRDEACKNLAGTQLNLSTLSMHTSGYGFSRNTYVAKGKIPHIFSIYNGTSTKYYLKLIYIDDSGIDPEKGSIIPLDASENWEHQTKTLNLKSGDTIKIDNVESNTMILAFREGLSPEDMMANSLSSQKLSKGYRISTSFKGYHVLFPNKNGSLAFTGRDIGATLTEATSFNIMKMTHENFEEGPVTLTAGELGGHVFSKTATSECYLALMRFDLSNYTEEQKKHVVLTSDQSGSSNGLSKTRRLNIIHPTYFTYPMGKEMDYSGEDYAYALCRLELQPNTLSFDSYYQQYQGNKRYQLICGFSIPEQLELNVEKTIKKSQVYALPVNSEKTYQLIIKDISSYNQADAITQMARKIIASNGYYAKDFIPFYNSGDKQVQIYLGDLSVKSNITLPSDFKGKTIVVSELPAGFSIASRTYVPSSSDTVEIAIPRGSLVTIKLEGYQQNANFRFAATEGNLQNLTLRFYLANNNDYSVYKDNSGNYTIPANRGTPYMITIRNDNDTDATIRFSNMALKTN